ncbi:thiamine diphosphokinase [Weissella coleopterorum]|uniref:Thiamine diphosphokinase n=1 Tax=Weissella coleopterorum TaxID=2714949 RepID=A0A6G8B081_9LACO|nr:thiamine diphosphokinase [Weissella coleopterorum]QIL50647.1 thiamine diphosphokinase [Weissella coleopterorum]
MPETSVNRTLIRLLVGGPQSEWPAALHQGKITGPWVAADRGALYLMKMGITPILTLGDLDSIHVEKRSDFVHGLPSLINKEDQIQTDTEAILQEVERRYQPQMIEIYGATGGRLDHLLNNIFMFAKPYLRSIATHSRLIDKSNVIDFYLPGAYTITKQPGMQYLGFAAITPVKGLTLIDEKYPLNDWEGPVTIWGSNEFIGQKNHFSFKTGMIAVIQSKDAN